jgi:hypothetical protein
MFPPPSKPPRMVHSAWVTSGSPIAVTTENSKHVYSPVLPFLPRPRASAINQARRGGFRRFLLSVGVEGA